MPPDRLGGARIFGVADPALVLWRWVRCCNEDEVVSVDDGLVELAGDIAESRHFPSEVPAERTRGRAHPQRHHHERSDHPNLLIEERSAIGQLRVCRTTDAAARTTGE